MTEKRSANAAPGRVLLVSSEKPAAIITLAEAHPVNIRELNVIGHERNPIEQVGRCFDT
jgi:hypothetical protein